MPRDRTITMGKVSAQEAHAAAIKKSLKLYIPYAVLDGELAGADPGLYAVVFTAPLGGDRYLAATRKRKKNAKLLRDMLNRAWAEGHWASMRE